MDPHLRIRDSIRSVSPPDGGEMDAAYQRHLDTITDCPAGHIYRLCHCADCRRAQASMDAYVLAERRWRSDYRILLARVGAYYYEMEIMCG